MSTSQRKRRRRKRALPTLAEVRTVKERVEASLLALPGVTGVDVGYKLVAGKKTALLAIRVYVERKLDLPAEQQIPAAIEGIPTDVIERRFVLHPGSQPVS